MTQSGGGAERRKQRRVPMKLPVRVQGRESDGTTWQEMSSCEDASAGGVGLTLTRPVVLGQVLHLSLPFPQRFRQYDLTDPSYRVYALVRNVRPAPGGGVRIGTLFLGKQPPRGAQSLPGELFLMPGDPTPVERRKFPRHMARLSLRLGAENAPGGVAVEEKTFAEDVSLWGAQVRCVEPAGRERSRPPGRGDRRRLQDPRRGAQRLDRRGRAAAPQPALPRQPCAGAAAPGGGCEREGPGLSGCRASRRRSGDGSGGSR